MTISVWWYHLSLHFQLNAEDDEGIPGAPVRARSPTGNEEDIMATELSEGFGPTLRTHRLAAERTLVDLAAHLGISPAYLHDIERGRRAPLSVERIQKAAQFLGCSERYFLRRRPRGIDRAWRSRRG